MLAIEFYFITSYNIFLLKVNLDTLVDKLVRTECYNVEYATQFKRTIADCVVNQGKDQLIYFFNISGHLLAIPN